MIDYTDQTTVATEQVLVVSSSTANATAYLIRLSGALSRAVDSFRLWSPGDERALAQALEQRRRIDALAKVASDPVGGGGARRPSFARTSPRAFARPRSALPARFAYYQGRF